MAEVFRKRNNGLVACQKPIYGGGAGADETEYYMSSFQDNYNNLARTIEIIKTVRPAAKIVITVSPIALERTFSGQDIVVANTESKAILRAATGQIARDFKDVVYFPSFEIAMGSGPHAFYETDGRHLNLWVVERIITAFLAAHLDKTIEMDTKELLPALLGAASEELEAVPA
jgi:hypothetical protein